MCTPDVVCTTIGNTDEMKIKKIGEAFPTPNQRMAMGIQAMGDIGRSIWKIGFNVVKAPRTHPIHSPSGTAKATASRNPLPTRNRDAPMCSHSTPFCISSPVPITTCHGVGKMTLCVSTTTSHHAPISNAKTVRDGKSFLSLFILMPCVLATFS